MDARPVIVLGVDFSPSSELALETAIRTAKDWRAGLVMVHALRPLGTPGLDLERPGGPVDNESADVTAGGRGGEAHRWVKRVTDAGVACDYVAVPGGAVHALVEEATRRNARAIIVGSHGTTGVEKMILGSVATGVLAKSTVPVLVVPGRMATNLAPTA